MGWTLAKVRWTLGRVDRGLRGTVGWDNGDSRVDTWDIGLDTGDSMVDNGDNGVNIGDSKLGHWEQGGGHMGQWV